MYDNIPIPRLLQNAKWFVKLRWIVIFLSFIAVYLGKRLISVNLSFHRLFTLIFILLIINLCYYFIIKYKVSIKKTFNILHLRLFLNLQVSIDLAILTTLLHFSGGIENPMIVFFIFHMILSSILLPRLDSFIQATIALLFFMGLVLLEYYKIIPHYSINEYLSGLFESDIKYLSAALIIFTLTAYMVVYLTSYVTKQLRQHEIELEQLNTELQEKDRIKNEYVLRLTHDIKGYVSSIKSNMEVVNRKIYGSIDENYSPYIKGINQVIKNLSRFIKDLLQLTRSKLAGDMDMQSIQISVLMENAIEETAGAAQKKNISCKVEIEPNQKSLFVFPLSVQEMLVNIISNAIKYSPEGSEIIIKGEKHNNNYAADNYRVHVERGSSRIREGSRGRNRCGSR